MPLPLQFDNAGRECKKWRNHEDIEAPGRKSGQKERRTLHFSSLGALVSWWCLFFCAVSIGVAADLPPAWLDKIPPLQVGTFPLPAARELRYTGGWAGVPAGKATIQFTQKDGRQTLHGTGTTIGVARPLFTLDTTYDSTCDPITLVPDTSVIDENYSDEKRHTVQEFSAEKVVKIRTTTPAHKDDKKQVFRLPNVLDLQSSMLYIRSQPLNDGDEIIFLTYATGSPYVAKVKVLSRGEITVRAGTFKAIQLQLDLTGIDKKLALKPYRKARNITAWLSDDADRNYLRISANMLVGSIFVDLDK